MAPRIKAVSYSSRASKDMYHQNPRVRDAQNPYRTGVLIGNCWEDKFGMELAQKPVSTTNFSLQPNRNTAWPIKFHNA